MSYIQKYVASVDGLAHQSAVDIITELEAQLAEKDETQGKMQAALDSEMWKLEAAWKELAECRDKALEEAAELADVHFIYGHSVAGPHFAAALAEKIRSLKGSKP